jgi:serine/threonine protein kinase
LTDADGDGSVVPAGAPYLVMEYVSGGTLATRLGKADFPEQRALLLSLLDGLAHAHARRVVHQDIKPSNVLLAEDGPKLADFGVARALDRDGDRRGDELVLGTPGYMAPEQIRGDAGAIGPWTDLYAVGVLAFTLASGVLPFPRGATPGETMRAQLLGTMRPLVPVGAVPTGFEAWVRRLLDRDPRRRPELAAHAARALLELGPSEPKRGRRRKEHPRSTDGDGATQPIRTLRDRAKLDATTAPEPWPPPPPDWPADREIAEPRYVGAGLGGDDRTPSARRGIHPHAGGATARIVW